jgi:hypothetical protein
MNSMMPDIDIAPYEVLFEDQSLDYPNHLPTPNDLDGSVVLLNDSISIARVQEKFVMKFGVHVDRIETHNK